MHRRRGKKRILSAAVSVKMTACRRKAAAAAATILEDEAVISLDCSSEYIIMVSLESSNWAFLPIDLLILISDGLLESSNYLRFSLVCRSWLTAAICKKERPARECQKHVPMLLVPTKDESNKRRNLYSVTKNKVLNFQLSVPYGRRCCGSCYGWLATVDEDLGITLLNPFSSKTIKFPPMTQRPEGVEDPFQYEFEVRKVVLSANPSVMPNDFVVAAIYTVFGKLAYIKPGQKSWTYIDYETKTRLIHLPFLDVIFREGNIYTCDSSGRVLSFDVSGCEPEVTVVAPHIRSASARVYIVESSQGDLLVVQRFFEDTDYFAQFLTTGFKIIKLIGANGGRRCTKQVEINSLGEDALFLGDNYSMSVLASSFSNCQANCIYYTDDDDNDITPDFPLGFRDSGIYYLENASIGSHYKTNDGHMIMLPPIWIAPTLLI